MPEAPKLSVDTLRYVADNLILELRDDRLWERRILPDYHPELSKTEVAGWKTLGAGRETKPEGYIDVLEVPLQPIYELAIPKLMVALDEWTYREFRNILCSERRLEHLDSLLAMRADAHVYVPAYSGYGNTSVPTMRRANNVSSDEARVAFELAKRAHVFVLP